MELTKKQVSELTEILDCISDDQLVYDIVVLRSMILLEAVSPIDKAMFTNDILTHEAYRRGLKL